MKTRLCAALGILCALGLTIAVQGAGGTKKFPPPDIKPLPKPTPKPLPLKVKGIDPAAIELKVVVKKKINAFEADIAIVGTIKNIGTDDFKSGKGQQSVTLNEHPQGTKSQTLVTRQFTNLKSGEQFTLEVTRRWRLSDEFPPDFSLQINYDPDIFIDGNPHNDDVNSKDNRKSLTGQAIHDQLSKALAPAK